MRTGTGQKGVMFETEINFCSVSMQYLIKHIPDFLSCFFGCRMTLHRCLFSLFPQGQSE